MNRAFLPILCAAWLSLAFVPVFAQTPVETPIVIGTSYALPSSTYGGTREVNVWLPPGYGESEETYPVLYLLDGGSQQDFHHISGLAQLGTVNGTTRDVIVVGIASGVRVTELTFRSDDPEVVAEHPAHGESERFYRFIAEEALPFVEGRFRTGGETALMGESLAGLFVVETFLKAPEMFDHYVAVSPSLWWDVGRLAAQAGAHLRDHSNEPRTLILTIGDEGGEMQAAMEVLVANLRDHALAGLDWSYTPRPNESHATIYHGAALDAFRRLFPSPAG